ncbi:DNAJ domain protein [Reticulomyxa filosa]|uniref:DNAJ domain protein n=1 Tax=Reticulomyxa filosa TaxID=46433 RepID=X6P0Y4_RETFI|nr:DNAJ domain protein [Reticulomyxa filosa]|eukprot:ETO31207.1 DNAJ domain protein [Reticulomyxa filosa]
MSEQLNKDDFIDYYALLKVAFDAPKAVIIKSYYKIALIMHPDKNPDDPNADEKFALIVEAKEVLADDKSRQEYDIEYKKYFERLKRFEEQQKMFAAMNADLRQMREELDKKEFEYANNPFKSGANHFHHKVKKDIIKQELINFRQQINEMRKQKLNEMKSQRLKDLTSEDNMTTQEKSMVLVRWNASERPYAETELRTIFQVYGHIRDLEILPHQSCAFIFFDLLKSAEKACFAHDLEEDFGLKVSFAGEKVHRERIKQVQKWSKLRPKKLTFEEYHDYIRNRIFNS